MGYTRTPDQRQAILAAIRSMSWISIEPPDASSRLHLGPAARTLAAALSHESPLCNAAIASLQPGHTLIGLADGTGARYYLIDLRDEAIHILTERDNPPEEVPGQKRHHLLQPPAQSSPVRARSASIPETFSHNGVTGFQRTGRTKP
jgi:hypothetical protein